MIYFLIALIAVLFPPCPALGAGGADSLTVYYGYANGKSVMASIYPEGKNARFGYLELSYRF